MNPFQLLRGLGVKIYHRKETQKWCFTESLQWKASAHISSLLPEKHFSCYMQFRYCYGYECSVFPFIGLNSRAISQTLRSETKSSCHLSTFFPRLRFATSTRLGFWLVRVISLSHTKPPFQNVVYAKFKILEIRFCIKSNKTNFHMSDRLCTQPHFKSESIWKTGKAYFADSIEFSHCIVSVRGVYVRKLAPTRVSYWNDFLISCRVYKFVPCPMSNMTTPSWIDENYACATRSSLPADRFHTKASVRFAFTWYPCVSSYRSEILALAVNTPLTRWVFLRLFGDL